MTTKLEAARARAQVEIMLAESRQRLQELIEQREREEAFDFEPTPDEEWGGKALVTIDHTTGRERIIISAISDEEFEADLEDGLPVETLRLTKETHAT